MNIFIEKMEKSLDFFLEQIQNIRAGSISPSVVDSIHVDCFGQKTLLKHMANTTAVNNNVLVKPYEISTIHSIKNSLVAYGFNAFLFSKDTISVPIPTISGDEKEKIRKHITRLGEETKVAIRNIRKDAKKKITKETNKEDLEADLQEITDKITKQIDQAVREKIQKI